MEYLGKMLFTSPFKKLFFIFSLIIIIFEILVRIFPIYYLEKPEKFLITYLRNKIEKGNNSYEIIILGDSRSMSLKPNDHKIYNFSLPAMGTRYYKYFVKKYLKYNKKPKAILFAGSPALVHSGKGTPLVDYKLIPYTYPDISLKEYIYKRSIERILNISTVLFQERSIEQQLNKELLWDFFSHRFLFLFSTLEISEIYKGPEWFFIISQSIPLNYHTYKYRDGILNLFKIETYRFEKNFYGTPLCSCDKILEKKCQSPKSNLQDNLIMKNFIEKNNGFYNISDRIPPEKFLLWQSKKSEIILQQMNIANTIPNFDFSYTKEFIDFLNNNKILYIYITVPFPEYFKNGKYLFTFYQEFEKFLTQFPNAKIFYFPTPYYDPNLYSDQVHLTCEGATKLNFEFQNIVLPQIIEYAESQYKIVYPEN